MPRQPRIEVPGTLHHVMARGIDGQDIFIDEKEMFHFRGRLGDLFQQSTNECYAWALMRNHFHLLIRSGNEPLSRLMQRLLTSYAVYFNRKHKRSGHLFQNRFKSILCQEDLYFMQLVRYIHLNPLRSGQIKSINELNKYPFTGHAFIMEELSNTWQNIHFPLNWFGKNRKTSKNHYLAFMYEGLNEGERDDLSGGGLLRTAGNWQNLADLKKRGEKVTGDERMLGDSNFVESILKQSNVNARWPQKPLNSHPPLEQLVYDICKFFKVTPIDVCSNSKRRQHLKAKSLISYLSIRFLNYSGRDVARHLNINNSSVSRQVVSFYHHDILHQFLEKFPIYGKVEEEGPGRGRGT